MIVPTNQKLYTGINAFHPGSPAFSNILYKPTNEIKTSIRKIMLPIV
jgi:hypothetical protein